MCEFVIVDDQCILPYNQQSQIDDNSGRVQKDGRASRPMNIFMYHMQQKLVRRTLRL